MHTKGHICEKNLSNVCGKCLTQSGNLTEYRMTQSGEKPFKYDVCGKCFTQSGDLVFMGNV